MTSRFCSPGNISFTPGSPLTCSEYTSLNCFLPKNPAIWNWRNQNSGTCFQIYLEHQLFWRFTMALSSRVCSRSCDIIIFFALSPEPFGLSLSVIALKITAKMRFIYICKNNNNYKYEVNWFLQTKLQYNDTNDRAWLEGNKGCWLSFHVEGQTNIQDIF